MEIGQVRHKGVFKDGKFKAFKPGLLKKDILSRDGQAGYIVLENYVQEKTADELGYYYGGIITGTCMQTETFGGWDKREIDEYFQNLFLCETMIKEIDGQPVTFQYRNRISTLTKSQMAIFINKVIDYLRDNHDIEVLPSDMYIKGKYKAINKNGKTKHLSGPNSEK